MSDRPRSRLARALEAVGAAIASGASGGDVRATTAFEELRASIRVDPRVAPLLDGAVGAGFAGGAPSVDRFADRLADRCLRVLEADPRGVPALLTEFDAAFATGALRGELTLPLHNFAGPPRIEITDRLDLVESARGYVLRTTVHFPLAVTDGDPAAPPSARAAQQDLWIAMRALHLSADGVCWARRVVPSIVGPPFTAEAKAGSREPAMGSHLAFAPLTLSEADAPAASTVVRWCLEEPARHALRLPLRRLHTSLRRVDDEARLIDLVSGLRALLTPHFDTDLALRFAVRGSVLLGTDLDERQAVFLRLREAYRQRDQLRHGGVFDPTSISLDALTDDLRRCIRVCAQHIAETHESIPDFVAALEAHLLR